jgi:hypothetical protein
VFSHPQGPLTTLTTTYNFSLHQHSSSIKIKIKVVHDTLSHKNLSFITSKWELIQIQTSSAPTIKAIFLSTNLSEPKCAQHCKPKSHHQHPPHQPTPPLTVCPPMITHSTTQAQPKPQTMSDSPKHLSAGIISFSQSSPGSSYFPACWPYA